MTTPQSRLVPLPQKLETHEGLFPWTGPIQIIVEPDNDADRFAAELLADACRQRGLAVPEIRATQDLAEAEKDQRILIGDPCRNWPLLQAARAAGLDAPPEIVDQGYALLITPRQILLCAYTSEGIYYAVQTLIQLLPTGKDGHAGRDAGATKNAEGGAAGTDAGGTFSLPCLRIDDWTPVRQRGIMLDLYCGEVYTLAMLKETVRRMAHYKMNLLILYFEDAFLFPSHPDIGEGRDRITPEEAAELVEFGRLHHVEIVPCYDTPGHMHNTLAHPKYRYLREGETPENLQDVIDITHPDAYPLLRDLYTDLCRIFPSQYHYVAGDEALQIGGGKNKALRDAVGNANLFLRHVKRMREILLEHGKRMALAGDPFEPGFFRAFGLDNYGIEALQTLPHDVIIGPWHYGEVKEYPFGQQLKDMGFDQYLWTSTAAFDRLFPADNAINVETFAPYAHDLRALGIVYSDWNIYERNTFTEYNWPGYACFAEWAWNRNGRLWKDLYPIVMETFYGPGTAEIAEVIRFLADISRHFHWAGSGWGYEFRIFFDVMGPQKPKAEDWQERLNKFREELHAIRQVFDGAAKKALWEKGHLTFLDFALDQQALLAGLVECRALMALEQEGRAAQPRIRELLGQLQSALPPLTERYSDLWLGADKPLGLEPNRKRFLDLQASVASALAARQAE